ncbi:NAD-dependent epimerase/dehydratase [Salipiger mucosus DSM 16094]|uniref:NAD-dependent epimerase/dehydratase n=1 Tax=Salipiger mucosus DSM 16094 TaxID=1123237 RepID=S9QRP6_9RHOB|nr:NAD-dependent epimerase/dehydratase [Salipiger mucosus DSM 16094]
MIHAAAHLGGDAVAHTSDTLRATRQLLDAMPPGQRLVLVSSIAVYDTMRVAPGGTLDESAPLEDAAQPRDAYAAAKLGQEALVRDSGRAAWLMRPGVVWGPGRTWHALMGFRVGPLFVQAGSDGELPLAHVGRVAETLVRAALTDPGGVKALNVIDDDRPDRARFLSAHRRAAGWPRAALSLPWPLWLAAARALRPLGERRPGLLREPVLRARLMPLRYPNAALRAALGGADAAPFETTLQHAVEAAP